MFGITIQDIEMQAKIQAAGLTVDQAFEMKKAGTLDAELAADLDKYAASLEADKASASTGESK